MIGTPWRGALLCAALVSMAPAPPGVPAVSAVRRDIRGVDALARAYDFILEGRFDQVDAELRRACGPAPPEACDVLGATALWWRILLDPENRSLDDEFSTAVDAAIRAAEAWTVRSRGRGPA